jgi:hypothetical protein
VGALGYWKLDEGSGTTAADSSGSGNNGTLAGGPVWTTGRTGGALNFSNPASMLSINGAGNLSDLYTTGMTVTAWINPTAGAGRIVDKDSTNAGWFFKMNNASSVQFVADQFATAAAGRTSANLIVLNQWQHVAATWDGTTNASNIHIYINGVQSDAVPSTAINGSGAAQSDVATPFTIGNRPDATRNFNGSIDGVRVYNRILSPQEIQSLVAGGS